MSSLLIVNATLVNEGAVFTSDVLIRQGRIERIAPLIASTIEPSLPIIDAKGLYLLPGLIDDQVHFREPGLTKKGDLASESLAAVAGGVTSFMEMPNTNPVTLTLDDLTQKAQLAQGRSFANYAFYLGGVGQNLELIKRIDPRVTCGVSVFIGSSCTSKLVDDPDVLKSIFRASPVLVAAHCEDMPTIIENEESYRSIYGDNIPLHFHPNIRSEEACWLAASRAVSLAEQCDTRLHLLHISTARELALLSQAALSNKRITAEVCPHYLHFSEEDYEAFGNLIKVNPAIKTGDDRAALLQGLLDGRIDMIGSGHAPHGLWEKQGNNYFTVPAGLPMVQDMLLSLLEHYHDGIWPLPVIVEKTSHAVATAFEIKERGFIREGYWADLVLVDLTSEYTVKNEDALAKCLWTPFAGYTFRSRVVTTLVNGVVVWSQNQQAHPKAIGRALEFERETIG